MRREAEEDVRARRRRSPGRSGGWRRRRTSSRASSPPLDRRASELDDRDEKLHYVREQLETRHASCTRPSSSGSPP